MLWLKIYKCTEPSIRRRTDYYRSLSARVYVSIAEILRCDQIEFIAFTSLFSLNLGELLRSKSKLFSNHQRRRKCSSWRNLFSTVIVNHFPCIRV